MKFTCDKEIILGVIQTTSKAAASKSTISALEGILLELSDGILKVTGYNLEIGISTEVPITDAENGNVVLNAKMAGDIIRKMPAGNLEFIIDDSMLCTIRNKHTEFSVMGMSADEYPSVPKVNPQTGFSMPQKTLKSMIIQTKYACSVSDTKPVFTGCKFEITDNVLNVVAVDGVRIALRQEPVVYDNIDFIVPAKTLEELTHILSDDNEKTVTLCIDKNQISFQTENYTMISRLIDGEFIPYKNHLVYNGSSYAEVNCREIIDMLDRATLIINEKNKAPIRCEFTDGMLSMSCATALGKISDKIAVKYGGNPLTVGFNAKYLLEAFRACDTDTARVALTESSVAPILILPMEGNEFTFMLLPMRLK